MENELGALLRQLRTNRQYTLSGLAARSGVSKATLQGWEAGLHQPRIPELLTVLDALNASLLHRERAVSLVRAPRAVLGLQAILPVGNPVAKPAPPPVAGHLLRSMRRRAGLSLQQVATVLQVRSSTVSRWERSENSPTPERMEQLLAFLDARPEEREVLADGRCLVEPVPNDPEVSLAALTQQLDSLVERVERGDHALLDLEFLRWEAQLWPLARSSPEAEELLAEGWSHRAIWLYWENRLMEAGEYADQVLNLLWGKDRPGARPQAALGRAIHVLGTVIRDGPGVEAPLRALAWLRGWLPMAAGSPWEVALHVDLAEAAVGCGLTDEAQVLATQAMSIAQSQGDLSAYHLAQGAQADVALQRGRPQEALRLLTPDLDSSPVNQAHGALRCARALFAMGDRSTASRWLGRAEQIATTYGLVRIRHEAEQLAEKAQQGA